MWVKKREGNQKIREESQVIERQSERHMIRVKKRKVLQTTDNFEKKQKAVEERTRGNH